MKLTIVLAIVLSWPLTSTADERDATISAAVCDAHKFHIHDVDSPYQEGRTQIRVLLPKGVDASRRHSVIYVLPVEAQDETKYGDGLLEIQKQGLHNKHDAIVVMPTFSATPWYCDHPSEVTLRQESHFLNVVVPFVERSYPVAKGPEGRLLLGFSKSGWGAWSLLLRHPGLFSRAVAWDAPMMLEKIGPWDSAALFGTQENFESYCVSHLLRARASKFENQRLFLPGYGEFREQHVQMHNLLGELRIPHEYRDGPERKHNWHSGWLPDAVDVLLAMPTEERTKS
jgi:S-formylglutathione hydrolase FrmB